MSRDDATTTRSLNAAGEHVHTPEQGADPDDALRPGNHSGSGDVEHAQRLEAMRQIPPDQLSQDQRDELMSFGQLEGAAEAVQPDSVTHADEVAAAAPQGDSREQLQRVQERNQQLLDGAEASREGEASINGVHTQTSGPQRTGDYSND